MSTLFPIGYGTTLASMDRLREVHEPRMHPEYARRLFAWIAAQGGPVGIGGGWRSTNPSQPGFAPDGQSFHQTQQFRSGLGAYAAVDLVVAVPGRVHRAPTWGEVPRPGDAQAQAWGLHANVSGEPWHLQPVELRGWQSWVNAGRPDPVAGYPIPVAGGTPGPAPTPDPDQEDPDMPAPRALVVAHGPGQWIVSTDLTSRAPLSDPGDLDQLLATGLYVACTLTADQMERIPVVAV